MANETRDETDPTGLRWFAKRIAEMKWWGEGRENRAVKTDLEAGFATPSAGQDQPPPRKNSSSAKPVKSRRQKPSARRFGRVLRIRQGW